MPEPGEILTQLRTARAAETDLGREAHAARLEHISLMREKKRLGGGGDRDELQAVEAKLQQSSEALSRRVGKQDDARRKVADLIDRLHATLSPETLTGFWSADTPILLLPLRVETRFKDSELLVRVFPDEISIDTHEEILTHAEAKVGQEYWRTIGADGSETSRKEAWRKLVEAFEAPRAAYVLKRTKPTNWADLATVGIAGLTFPVESVLKEDSWTQPPLVKVLPDLVALTLSRAGKEIHRLIGKLIPDVVQAGPAPLMIDGRASWKRGADGRMVFDTESEWLRDFKAAVEMGLGFRVALKPGDEAGFDELIVLGLKHSADVADTEALITELLAGHRYSVKGLALVPQGTATNNTSGEDAGLDGIDWFADASFAAAKAGDTPEVSVDLDTANDGRRLAAYLGLDPELFAGVPHADGHDHAEAVAMNAALYPGTLGYFLRTMVGEVAGDATLDDLRELFIHNVTGRGPLASIRVGNQPYGIVLAGPAPRFRSEPMRENWLDLAIEGIIAKARQVWTAQVSQLARLGATSNGSADLLAVMGLQPTAADYFQRIATTYDHLSNLAGFQTGGDRMGDVFESVFAGIAADSTLVDFGYQIQRANGTFKPYPLLFQLIYQRHQTLIPQTSLIDGQPFSESDIIKPYDVAQTKNYIDWLTANARSADALRAQDFGGAPKPTALLYMLLRHALLIQVGTSVNRWLKLFDIEAPELVMSRKFVGMTPAVDVAAWEFLSAPASAVSGTVSSDLSLLAMVHLPEYRTGIHAPIGAPLEEMLAAYGVLRGLPTARLERLLAEHVDTLSYRLDAWETALIDRRLVRRRLTEGQIETRRGLYIGAVGYLENVRAVPGRRKPLEESTLHESLREGHGDLFSPADGAGFVHTPSLNHATAAAVLRNGYLTHATPDDPGRLAINLSSRRVRRAKELMDGVRNGQPIEVLLGIEFERGLHDATTRPVSPVVLNDLKPAFRQAFPIKRTKIPKAGHPGDAPEIVPDFSVVNGLDVIAAAETFPAGVPGLPALSTTKSDELKAIRDRLKDSLDSLKDVVTTESAYQLALGNFDRSAAIVQSLSAAVAPPEIEVTRSSRGTDLSFTQRLTIELDPAVIANPWAPIAMTPRAQLEPPLNAWIGSLLGDPAKFSCKVSLTEAGATTETAVRLSELVLQPLDLMHMTRGVRDAAGPQELEARIHTAALAATGASRDAVVAIAFATTGLVDATVASMGDALAVLDLVHQVLSSARPIDGRDSLTASQPLPTGTDPSGIDVAELRTRFGVLKTNADTLVADLGAAVTNAKASGGGVPEFTALRDVLRRAADAGVPFSFPAGADDTLVRQGETITTALATLRDRAVALDTESQVAGLSPPQAAGKLIAAVHELLGADFRVLPRFTAPNVAKLAASDATRLAMLTHAQGGDPTIDPVSDVLTSVAQVRHAAHRLHRLRIIAELTTGAVTELAAIQLPPRTDDVWLGAALPPNHEILDDTLSIIQLRPQGFAPASARCGLQIDEWTESFPRKSEVTGLAFNFDQPNSGPMQSLLLAVAGEGDRIWSWDDLMGIVRDTMLRAKLRAVEPDMLDKVPGVTTLTPATMAEFSTSPGALSLDFGLSVPIILTQVMATAYMADFVAAGTSP
ncbi:hypothetical protein [Mesorhizobium sp. WSM2561]|uniref:hypothetical protein n=1 Tax=Mesorhizobium sp. WSM2561 TaxID=1040985 RepID=UPI00047F7532|nr:hypothetical protein [Mesorhizobium sp. WSM2561]